MKTLPKYVWVVVRDRKDISRDLSENVFFVDTEKRARAVVALLRKANGVEMMTYRCEKLHIAPASCFNGGVT